jgi:stage II sporulation protein D
MPPADADSSVPGSAAPMDRTIRVLLLEGVESFEFAIHGPFTIRDKNGRAIEPGQGQRIDRTIGRVDRQGGLWLRLGPFITNSPQVDIMPATANAVEVTVPDRNDELHRRRFRGGLRIQLNAEGMIEVMNVVDVEDYLRGVICGELLRTFHVETFKVQAMVARTYALYQKVTAGKWRDWDVKATESSQMYIGFEGENRSSSAIQAVEETTGIVCTWASPQGQKIFCTYYSSTCGGCTQSVANVKGSQALIPPLAGEVFCNYCSISPNFRWPEVRLTKAQVTERLLRRDGFVHLRPLERIEDIRVVSTTKTGRAVDFQLVGSNGRTAMIRAEDFRLLIGGHILKSTHFELDTTPTEFVFKNGRGYGHGVGLCQYGAEGQARRGILAAQILAFYYPGCRLEAAYH